MPSRTSGGALDTAATEFECGHTLDLRLEDLAAIMVRVTEARSDGFETEDSILPAFACPECIEELIDSL